MTHNTRDDRPATHPFASRAELRWFLTTWLTIMVVGSIPGLLIVLFALGVRHVFS